MQGLVRETISHGRDTIDPAALAAQVRLFRSAALAGANQAAVTDSVAPDGRVGLEAAGFCQPAFRTLAGLPECRLTCGFISFTASRQFLCLFTLWRN